MRIAEIATGNRDDALEIVQDAMLKLASRYAARPEREWAPLFQRILQSRITDFHRRSVVRRRWRVWLASGDEDGVRPDPIENQPGPASTEPDRQSDAERMTAALERALQALPLRQRQAFLLRVWEDLDVAETARAMGCSEGSVKTHLSRAMHALRAALGDYRW